MTYSMDNPSPAYRMALEESREHHRWQKTWSGGLMTRHVERIRDLIVRTGSKSMLDYGCGKLLQYFRPAPDGRSVDEYLGVPIYKMDPAMPENYRIPPEMGRREKIATTLPPDQRWDLVVVTHVLGSIPVVDLQDWVVPLLHRVANKAIFVAENLNAPSKNPFSTTAEKPRQWTAAQWMELLRLPGSSIEIDAWFRGAAGNDPRASGLKGHGFRRWPFSE